MNKHGKGEMPVSHQTANRHQRQQVRSSSSDTWISHHISNRIPKVTKHRAALPPLGHLGNFTHDQAVEHQKEISEKSES